MSGLARDRNRHKVSQPLSPTALTQHFQTRKKSDLRFSWDERGAGGETENWTLQKVLHDCHLGNSNYSLSLADQN